MARTRRVARHVLMEEALDKALSTLIPEKNTGPEPEDILVPPAAPAPSPPVIDAGTPRPLEMVLDKKDRERAKRISDILSEISGESKGTADALRIALRICRIDRARIERAYKEIAGSAGVDPAMRKVAAEG